MESFSSSDPPQQQPGIPGSGSNLPRGVLLAATISAVLSTVLSLWTIVLQLRNYRKPRLQRFVVRILIMVPIYAISSLISLYSLDAAFFVDTIRDLYEAFVIYAFFTLLVEYLGGERSLIILLHGRPPIPHPWPMRLFLHPMDASDPYTFLGLKRGILQYVQVKPILAAITIILKATNIYKDGQLEADAGYTYVSIAYNVSVALSLYCLAMFWVATHDDLQPYRPMPKFLCVKGIIFFSFWQGFAVSILVAAGVLKSYRYDTELLSVAIQDTLICLEMPLFAFMHLYAFSYTDYIDENHTFSGRLPLFYALRDAFGYKDVFSDSLQTVKGSGFSYRTFEPVDGSLHYDGLGRDRRVKAGLRYTQGGKYKHWLPKPGDEVDAHGRGGRAGAVTRPLHAARRLLEERLVDQREGYAPLLDEEVREAVHRDEATLGGLGQGIEREDWERWRREEGAVGLDGREFDDLDSDPESLGFGALESEEETEELYEEAKGLEFGDWSYPVVDASREDARRRLREEDEGRVHGKRLKPKKTKGKTRADSRPPPSKRFSYGQLAEDSSTSPKQEHHQSSSPSAPATSSDHPEPKGAHVVAAAKNVWHAATGGTTDDERAELDRRRKEERARLPPDAIDLVVQDHQAEEEEQIQARRRGEPGGKRRKIYRVAYVPDEDALSSAIEDEEQHPGETVEIKDVVPRDVEEDGIAPTSEDAEEVVRVRVTEQQQKATLREPPEVGELEPPAGGSKGAESEDENPWDR